MSVSRTDRAALLARFVKVQSGPKVRKASVSAPLGSAARQRAAPQSARSTAFARRAALARKAEIGSSFAGFSHSLHAQQRRRAAPAGE